MSFRDSVLTVFPVPHSLSPLPAGIDISSGSVKSITLGVRGGRAILRGFFETSLPEGVIREGDIEQKDRIVEILRIMRLKNGIHAAHACLPERKAYIYETIVPADAKDLKAGVEYDFEAHVPLPPGETIYDFQPIRRMESGTLVSVTAYAKRVVSDYRSAFAEAGIELRSLEVESSALVRATLHGTDLLSTVMIIDFGRKTTRIAIAEQGVVAFTATVDIGGDTLSSAIMKNFKVPDNEAEQIKNERGFLMNKENKDLVDALMSTVSVVKDEVARHLTFWNSPPADEPPRRPVDKVIVCGGNANLRGFPEYLEGAVGIPVSIANAWENAFSLDEYIPPMPFPVSLASA
ncbi:MAG: type IV pilus assembly protein PilM, partial [Patescibacteria group bacterium]